MGNTLSCACVCIEGVFPPPPLLSFVNSMPPYPPLPPYPSPPPSPGLTHWEVNPSCESAQLMITFSAANPGTILTNVNLAAMPSDLQMRLFGKLAANATYLGTNGVVGWWPEDPVCVARCQAAAANRRAKF